MGGKQTMAQIRQRNDDKHFRKVMGRGIRRQRERLETEERREEMDDGTIFGRVRDEHVPEGLGYRLKQDGEDSADRFNFRGLTG